MAEKKIEAAPLQEQKNIQVVHPVVNFQYSKKGKKKKYSRSLKGIQVLEDGLSKSLLTLSKGISSGFSSYRKARNKSASKRKDGAFIDFFPNAAKGFGKALRASSDAPYELAKTINTKRRRRRIRRSIRLITFRT